MQIETEGNAQIIEQPIPARPTKQDLITRGVDALDPVKVNSVQVSRQAGGIAFSSMLDVMEFSKLMAVADKAVPAHLRGQPGICLAITMQAIEWEMSPFAVANKSYVVNDRIAFESQLVHAVIEARAPLRERLDCTYDGEGPTRTCTVIGKFTDGSTRNYTSPQIQNIKTQNSPLWKSDPDQQLFYYSSRAFCRRWCPDVLLGIYTPDEMANQPGQIEAQAQPQDLKSKLAGAAREEGHQDGHAARELDSVAADKGSIEPGGESSDIQPADTKAEDNEPLPETSKKGKTKGAKKNEPKRTETLADPKKMATKTEAQQIADRAQARSDATKQQHEATQKAEQQPKKPQETDDPPKAIPKNPKTAAEYEVYCRDWIDKAGDPEAALKRWDDEYDLRTECVVPISVRNSLREHLEKKHGV